MYDKAGDEKKPNGGVDGGGENTNHEEGGEKGNCMRQIGGR